MSAIINVGLNTNDGGILSVSDVVDSFREQDLGRVLSSQVFQSNTEPTVVLEVVPFAKHGARQAVSDWAASLRQDCVAVYFPLFKQGFLIGPKAAEWGDFEPRYFLDLDGSFLSEE